MPSSIPRTHSDRERRHVRSRSLRALAVAAQLERNSGQEDPPDKASGQEESRRERRTPDSA